MKSLKFSIKVSAIDSYLYGGHLFLILKDGLIVYTELSKIIRKLVECYPHFENLIRLSFQRNDYLSNRQGLMILGLGEVKTILAGLWEKAANEMQFEIEYESEDFEVIAEIPSMPVLDLKLYAMRMYLGCKEGLYEINLNPEERYHLNPSKPEKRFDAKVTYLNAKSGEVIISANSEGLYHGSFLNSENRLKVIKKSIAGKSLRTGWSGYDVINYEEQNQFDYFVNETMKIDVKPEYSKFDEFTEKLRITGFGKRKYDLGQLLEKSEIEPDDISYCFNSSKAGFFFTKDSKFININFNKDDKDHPYLTSRSHSLPNLENTINSFKKPLSSSIVPKGCVVEYFDKVVLYQNAKAKIIESGPSINIRTYASSIRYKNLISVTKDNEVAIHSIFPVDENPVQLTFRDFDFTDFTDE